MEIRSSPEKLHGMIIANASLLRSLLTILPPELLPSLLEEMEDDAAYGRDFLIGQQISDDAVESYEAVSNRFLMIVRDRMNDL